jgi:hypothetical protein
MTTRGLKIGKRLVGGLALAAFVAAVTAAAQDEWTQQVRRLLQTVGNTFQQRGYSMTHNIYTGSLNQRATDTVTVNLNIGTDYQIMGVCDTDCSDVDLALYDPGGSQIDSDVLDDDAPIVSVTPGKSGSYRIKVMMIKCTSEPCRYGIGVFGK